MDKETIFKLEILLETKLEIVQEYENICILRDSGYYYLYNKNTYVIDKYLCVVKTEDHFIVTGLTGKYGVCDNYGNLLLVPQCDEISDAGHNKVVVKKNGMFSVEDLTSVINIFNKMKEWEFCGSH